MSNAEQLFAAIAESVPNGTPMLVIDLSPTTYIDSAGVRLLFHLVSRSQARRQGLRIVVPLESPIRAVLELMGLPMIDAFEERVITASEPGLELGTAGG
jgi:anti-sigma B factor antagonist